MQVCDLQWISIALFFAAKLDFLFFIAKKKWKSDKLCKIAEIREKIVTSLQFS